jgi:hypothetical protein
MLQHFVAMSLARFDTSQTYCKVRSYAGICG